MRDKMNHQSPLIKHGGVLLLLAILSLALTWPLLPHILTHVPGDGIDDPALAWNLWWAKESWVNRAGLDGLAHPVFAADVMFYPIGINLAFYTLTLLNGALSIPLQTAFNLILAANLLTLSSFIIGGFGAYLLAVDLLGGTVDDGRKTKDDAPDHAPRTTHHAPRTTPHAPRTTHHAALLAALLYAFASAKLFYVSLGQFNIASSQWLPFIALYLARILRPTARPRDGVMLGLFLCLQTWAELTYGTFGVLLVALVVIAVSGRRLASGVWRRETMRSLTSDLRPLISATAIAAVLFTLGLAPYLAHMLPDMAAEGDFLVEGGGFSDIFSADLAGFLLPTQLHPLFGDLIRTLADDSALRPDRSQFQVNKGQHLFFGYTVMLLAAWGVWANRRRAWARGVALLTGLFWLISLGPTLRANGYDTGIPGLFPLLLKIPFFQANRYPSRYSVLILLGLSLLLALGGRRLLQTRRAAARPRLTAALLAALLLFEHLSIPLPLSDFRPPAPYLALAADPAPGAVLDLPIGWRNGFNVFGKSDTIIMFTQWYQTYHGRPRLGGNTSRNPEQKFQYFLEHPVIGVLAALQDGREVSAADFAHAQALAPAWLRHLNLRHLIIHRDEVPPDFEQKLARLLPLDFVAAEGGVARYIARWPQEQNQVEISAGDPGIAAYLDRGWGAAVVLPVAAPFSGQSVRWAGRARPTLILPGLTRPAALRLTLLAPGPQTLHFWLEGAEIGQRRLTAGVNAITLPLPAGDGFPRRLQIASDATFSPGQIAYAGRLIGSTGVASPVHLTLRSAGKETGDFGHIYVNGVDHSPNQRGYNLVALDPADGRILAAAAFDTHDPILAPQPSRDLAAWVAALPNGAIVAGAVRDAAALSLTDEAWQALTTLGVRHDIRGHLRRGHAFVGVKGAAPTPGPAADFVSDAWPVTLAIGDGFSEPAPTFGLMALGTGLP